jgi:hypothetical protein
MYNKQNGDAMPMIMGLAPAVTLFVVCLVAAVASFWWGGLIYVLGIYVAAAIIVVSCASVRPPDDPMGVRKIVLSADEERLFKKYYAFFRFPFGAQNFAHFINYARMFGIVWMVISLWQRMWGIAIANVLFFLISGPLMWRLSPIAHYKAAAEKGAPFAVKELKMMQHILDSRNEIGF